MNTVPIQSYSSKHYGRKGPSFGKRRRGRPGFSGSLLKLVGVIAMLLDHIGVAVIEQGILKSGDPVLMQQILATDAGQTWWYADRVMRYAGRLAFPIFAFFLAEGFCQTRHRRDYGLRLLIFALLSEIPFDLAMFGTWLYLDYQNILVTLLIAYITLCGVQRFNRKLWAQLLCIAAGCGAAYLLQSDYGGIGVMIVVLLYWFRGTGLQIPVGAAAAALESAENWCFSALAFIPLAFYNGERGSWPRKYFFYVFYPAHLLVLWGIRMLFCR